MSAAAAAQLGGKGAVSVGSRIKQARMDKGLSRPDLAKLTGISDRTIEKYEYDTIEPTVGNLVKICAALEIPLDDVVAEIGGPMPPASRQGRGIPQRGPARGPVTGNPDLLPPVSEQELIRQITRFVNSKGGTVQFPARRGAPAVQAAVPGRDELAAIIELVSERGSKARPLPAMVSAAVAALGSMEYAELVDLADELQLPTEGIPEPEAVEAGDEDAQELATDRLMNRLIVLAICPDYPEFTAKALKALREDLLDVLPQAEAEGMPAEPGLRIWDHEAHDEAVQALRDDLPAFVVAAFSRGKRIALSDADRYPREGAEG